ncbi:RidA family protein [Ancylobacter sp. MQZ15Z-1]|uniref:RidA family protein n=1 Tax=Ancylobacter mangrovi TaxID=2972472 RepID=A0A9X2T783_9HYPH|nr:RidA family protein [Ancylobacter mangrovi]MCS0497244.1 RidA family protein [Ancylobacter mangrovi]
MNDMTRIDQNQRRSRAIVHNGIVYTAGQVPDDMSLDIAGQARQVLDKIDDLLKEAGSERGRILTAQVWLRTMEDFAAFNAVWDAWVVPGRTPTRCCGKVEMNNPACRVEILVTAAV